MGPVSSIAIFVLIPYYCTDCRLLPDAEIAMTDMTIGKVAEKAGVGVETIRFYERRGLIEQPKKPDGAGFRSYPDEVVAQVRFIRRAQQIGFSLTEIGELLSLKADPSSDCSDIRQRAAAKLEEVDEKIASLKRIRKALSELIAACPSSGALRACTILDALESEATVRRKNPS